MTGSTPDHPGRRDPVRVGTGNPFATPPERRDQARRLRGRLVAPVTVWTAGSPPGAAGLTVASVLVAEGEPPRLLGLLDPTTQLWEQLTATGAFVVHVLGLADQRLGERFSERRAPVQGMFDGLEVTSSPWGPLLAGTRPLAACRLETTRPLGRAELVEGIIERTELPAPGDPLAWYHGEWRALGEPGAG